MQTSKKFLRALRSYSPYFLWLAGVLVIFFNLYLTTKLNPLEQNLTVMAVDIKDINKQLETVSQQHMNFVQKDTFDQVVTRIDHISSRVDAIYSIISRK